MRILFDNGGIEAKCGGVSRYFAALMSRLSAFGCECLLPFSGSINPLFQRAPFNLPPRKDGYGAFLSPNEFRGKYRLWQLATRLLPRHFHDYGAEDRAAFWAALDKGDFDILHLTSPHRYGSDWKRVAGRKPIVVTIHDLVPELMPSGFSPVYVAAIRRERAEILSAASCVICVSENTRRDLLRLYPSVNPAKLRVIYHGSPPPLSTSNLNLNFPFRSSTSTLDFDSTNPFSPSPTPSVLFVGRKGGYKNYAWFERAMKPLLKEGWRIVCSDGKMTDAELAAAYARATVFVYPSLYEGFGLPILEAWAHRCPVVCTRASCFPEIAADAALTFAPSDADALHQHLRALASDPSLRARQIEKGLARLAQFSWDKCAHETMAVYAEAKGGNNG